MAYSNHFSIANLPYGIASSLSDAHRERAVATRLADKVVFLSDLALDVTDEARAAFKQVGSWDTKCQKHFADLVIAYTQRLGQSKQI
jgi:hypothetical protein